MSDDEKDIPKKSEKIEIRLSYEDKQDLTSVAETEGRSVSDLVRGLIRRYIQTTSSRLPQKKPWLIVAGIGFAGLLAGHLLTYAYTRAHNYHSDVYTLYASIGKHQLNTPVLAKQGFNTDIILANDEADIAISLSVENKDKSLPYLQVSICRQLPSGCEPIASPILHFNPLVMAELRLNNQNADEIYLRLNRPKK